MKIYQRAYNNCSNACNTASRFVTNNRSTVVAGLAGSVVGMATGYMSLRANKSLSRAITEGLVAGIAVGGLTYIAANQMWGAKPKPKKSKQSPQPESKSVVQQQQSIKPDEPDNFDNKHQAIISKIQAYAKGWKETKSEDAQAARFGGKNFWEENQGTLSKMGLKASDFYQDYQIPGNISAEAFHDGFMSQISSNHNRENLFDAIADYNPEIRELYDELSQKSDLQMSLNKSDIISGVACKFTIDDIKDFFVNGFTDDSGYPKVIQEANGRTPVYAGGKLIHHKNDPNQSIWNSNTCLGQHNWSPCKIVADKIERGLKEHKKPKDTSKPKQLDNLKLSAFIDSLINPSDKENLTVPTGEVSQQSTTQGVMASEVKSEHKKDNIPKGSSVPDEEQLLAKHGLELHRNTGGSQARCLIYSILMGATGQTQDQVQPMVDDIAKELNLSKAGFFAHDSEEGKKIIASIEDKLGYKLCLKVIMNSIDGFIISGEGGSDKDVTNPKNYVVIRQTPGHFDAVIPDMKNKRVRWSDKNPEVHIFQVNKPMKKTPQPNRKKGK